MSKPSWFVNYTKIKGSGRTTETKFCKTLKEGKTVAEGKFGYITRDSNKRYLDPKISTVTLHSYFGGFQPSAGEQQRIDQIIGRTRP